MLSFRLQEMISEVLDHKYGRRVILQLLAPFRNRYVPVEFQSWIRRDSNAGDVEDGDAEAGTEKKSTSLKVGKLAGLILDIVRLGAVHVYCITVTLAHCGIAISTWNFAGPRRTQKGGLGAGERKSGKFNR